MSKIKVVSFFLGQGVCVFETSIQGLEFMFCIAWSLHCSPRSLWLCLVSTIPLPFCLFRFAIPFCHSAVPLWRSVVPLPFFRSIRCGWERKCWKRLSVYIGMKRPERWLVVRLRQNGKIGFDPIATERRLRRKGSWQRQRRNGIFHVSSVICTALT